MWPYLAASGVILVVAGILAFGHWRAWRRASASALVERERAFAYGQYRRRMQVSAMLAIVGAMIAGGAWIAAPLAALLYWLGVVILVLWIMLLAGADLLASRMHFSKIETEHNLQRIDLQSQLDRARSAQRAKTGRNGR